MIDFNDEKITEEQKQDTLLQQIDRSYREKRETFGYEPFKGGWVIPYRMLEVLNDDAHTNEGRFDFYKKQIKNNDPSMTVGLLEGETIRKGEYDRFYKCWSKRDYIRCMVIFPEGLLTDIQEDGLQIYYLKLDPENEDVFKNKISKYPSTWNIDGSLNRETTGSGIIEFDPLLLDWLKTEITSYKKVSPDGEYDSLDDLCNDGLYRRIDNHFWGMKKYFDKNVRETLEGIEKSEKQKENRRNSRRKNKRVVKKSLNQGFSL